MGWVLTRFTGPATIASCLTTVLCLAPLLQGCASAAWQDAAADDPAALVRIGEAAEASGDLGTADNLYRRASELDSANAAASLAHARIIARGGDMRGALSALQVSHRDHPGDEAITGALGRMLIARGRPDEAATVLAEGLKRRPMSASLLVARGVALDMTEHHAEAQQAYRAALQVDPDNAAARSDLDLSLAKQKDSGGAGKGG